jgi:hypothetical protein
MVSDDRLSSESRNPDLFRGRSEIMPFRGSERSDCLKKVIDLPKVFSNGRRSLLKF